ncbi:MAG: hypothetical protein PSX36_02355 [bacterium]|nr:hypothetical protein [bacterium]
MKKLLVLFLFISLASCKKKSSSSSANNNPVPYVPVSISVYPNDPLNFSIQSIGGWKYMDGGIYGIVVYRKSEQEFVALERSSSFYPGKPEAKVFVMSDNFILRDSISESRWRIIDGGVTKGPATWPLRVYATSYDGNVLRIRN